MSPSRCLRSSTRDEDPRWRDESKTRAGDSGKFARSLFHSTSAKLRPALPAVPIAFRPLERAFSRPLRARAFLYEGLWRYPARRGRKARLAAVIQISHSLMMKVRGDAVAPGRDLAATDRLNDNRRRKTSRFFTRARAAPLGLFLEPRTCGETSNKRLRQTAAAVPPRLFHIVVNPPRNR